ncbi:hypothetical protein LCGC14_0612150 [marine sediment metagenome]|uniref:Beta-lactamase n=1 Tax=marine sediment metagenome TaxID=412755 RepID=A0A0F9UFW0_9ZZZZ
MICRPSGAITNFQLYLHLTCHASSILGGGSVAEYDQKVLRCLGGEGTGCYLAGYYAKYDKRIPRDMQRALYEYGCQLRSDDTCRAVASMR